MTFSTDCGTKLIEIQKQLQQDADHVDSALMSEVKTIISSLIKEISEGKLRESTIIRSSKRSKIQKHMQQNGNHVNKVLKITKVKTQLKKSKAKRT